MTFDKGRTELEERLKADACIDSEERKEYMEEEEYYLECEKRWVFLMLMLVAGFTVCSHFCCEEEFSVTHKQEILFFLL